MKPRHIFAIIQGRKYEVAIHFKVEDGKLQVLYGKLKVM